MRQKYYGIHQDLISVVTSTRTRYGWTFWAGHSDVSSMSEFCDHHEGGGSSVYKRGGERELAW